MEVVYDQDDVALLHRQKRFRHSVDAMKVFSCLGRKPGPASADDRHRDAAFDLRRHFAACGSLIGDVQFGCDLRPKFVGTFDLTAINPNVLALSEHLFAEDGFAGLGRTGQGNNLIGCGESPC
ncbi:hypothetical protein CK219_05240 [Mesorhizobium sp. WSM4313]|nr:hypothetical protein CK219_05240 [Mesorhizobium sp. WSM4313]